MQLRRPWLHVRRYRTILGIHAQFISIFIHFPILFRTVFFPTIATFVCVPFHALYSHSVHDFSILSMYDRSDLVEVDAPWCLSSASVVLNSCKVEDFTVFVLVAFVCFIYCPSAFLPVYACSPTVSSHAPTHLLPAFANKILQVDIRDRMHI